MVHRIVVLATLWLLSSQPAVACVCEAPDLPLETFVASLFEESSVVGVFSVDGFRFDHGRWAVLGQRHSFKGNVSELLARAPVRLFKTDCDMQFRKDELLLVYATSSEPLHLSMCSHSGYLMSRFDHIPFLFSLAKRVASP